MAALSIGAAFYSSNNFDQKIFDFIAPHISTSRTRFMQFISFWGNAYFLIPANLLLLFYFIYKKEKWWAIRAGVISLTSLGWMSLLKNLIHRHRPADPLVHGITNFSFPSGHAFMSVAFYGLLVIGAATCIKNKLQKPVTIIFFILLILTIGFSRIYLRVHYSTDVLAGFSLGTAWLILSLAVLDKLQARDIAESQLPPPKDVA
jgi:undecaprenyl-diphosphatase